MTTSVATVGELATQIRGVTFAKADASTAPAEGLVPVLRAGNITDDGLNFDDLVYVPSSKVAERQRLRRDDVLIAASSGSLSVVGKAARVTNPNGAAFGAFCKVLRPSAKVDPGYFAHYFKTPAYRRRMTAVAEGANINNLRSSDLDTLQIRLPPLDEQRRIARILDSAESLHMRRRAAITVASALSPSAYRELAAELDGEAIPLGDVAEVVSGITKGRRTNGQVLAEVPYLAVSNVQAGRLDMSVVKRIDATAAEIDRYRLKPGDLLLTEGGDPDKLGRGALWSGELEHCIHQNHIFRVRVRDASALDPVFLQAQVAAPPARAYFFRAAKQTTGIASINKTQLAALPVQVPSVAVQRAFAERVNVAARVEHRQKLHLAALDALFASLQQRAFVGEL